LKAQGKANNTKLLLNKSSIKKRETSVELSENPFQKPLKTSPFNAKISERKRRQTMGLG